MWPAAISLVAVALAYGVTVFLQSGASPAPAASPARTPALTGRVAIRTSLATQYGTTVWLEDSRPVSLVLECEMSRGDAQYDTHVRWRCSRGRLEREGPDRRNRFNPPAHAAVSTIEADLALYPKPTGPTSPTAVFRDTVVLRVISPVAGSLLRDGEIDGYRVGQYLDPRDPEARKRFDLSDSWASIYPDKFAPPAAFYLVDDESRNLQISRHLRLGDFALDYPWFSLGKRQYIALDPGLVRKIEDLIVLLNEAGLPADQIRFIYGFRPPAYNTDRVERDGSESLKAPFSLHQYGKAVDLILDADGDLKIDDLDGDGQITVRDAGALVHYVNVLDRRYREQDIPLYGGAGIYDHHDFWERPVQSPYVHMDVRGFLTEKRHLIRWPGNWPGTNEPIPWGDL